MRLRKEGVMPTRIPFTWSPRFKMVACGFAAGAAMLTALPLDALACTQFWVPAQYTASGNRFVGRNEDGGTRYFKTFGVSQPQANTTYSSGESSFSWTSDKTSYRYTFIRDAKAYWEGRGDAYSAAGINEHGVSASATLSTDYNDQIAAIDPLNEESGIGEYNYVSIILGESKTAREGVELIGRLVSEYGALTCDQLTISDVNESWLFMVLSGHEWLAMQMPEDKVSVNPNMSNLRFDVDLDDPTVCLHSEGLLTTPGDLLKYQADGKTPDIAATYGADDASQGIGQNNRYGQGRAYFGAPLAKDSYEWGKQLNGDGSVWREGITKITEPELFFTPGLKDMSTFTIVRAHAARGEQTDNLNADLNPAVDAIGKQWQMEGHMFEIRDDLPADIATVQWETMAPTEFSVAMPFYSALLTEASPYFKDVNQDTSHSGAGNFWEIENKTEYAMEEEPEGSIDYVLIDINTLAYNNRASMAAGTRAYLDALQKQIIAQHELVDAIMQATPAEKRAELANSAHKVMVEQTYRKCDKLLDEMRAYIKAGDFSTPFAASDYDAQAKDMKTPLVYAPTVILPAITAQPASATYEQNAAAADLAVTAKADDGVGALSYEWFRTSGDTVSSTGVKTANMAVDTSKTGSQSYFCRITNAAGKSVDSNVATITVTAPAAKPGDGASDTSKPGASKPGSSKPAGDLPQTGDPLSMAGLAGLAASGIAAAVAGIKRRVR